MKGNKFITHLKQVVPIFFISLLLLSCGPKVGKRVDFGEKRVRAIDSFINSVRMLYHIPGVAFAIVHQDSVYSNAVGIKNGGKSKLTATTPILAGSISEPVLAYAILQLAEWGKINLDDRVVQYLPYFKMSGNSYQQITIRNLLTHTSGIDNYTVFYDRPSFNPNASEITTRSLETQVPKWELPEIQILRSPYNYDILADLIHKVTGSPFEEYVKEKVFVPFQMSSSYFYRVKHAAQPFRVTNYLDYSYEQADIYPYNRENGGSRGLHASVHDLSEWMFQVLNLNRGCPGWFKEDFFSMQFKTGRISGIGFGWDIYKDEEETGIYTKSSEFGGFSSQLILIPAQKTGVVILTNIHSDFRLSNIAALVAAWLNNQTDLKFKIPVYLSMGKKLKETGQVSAAIKEFYELKQRASESYDFSEKALVQLGTTVLYQEKRPAWAIEIFNFCSREYPYSSDVYLNLAEAHLLNNDLANCRLNIEKANRLPDPAGRRRSFVNYLNEYMEMIEEKATYPNNLQN